MCPALILANVNPEDPGAADWPLCGPTDSDGGRPGILFMEFRHFRSKAT